MIAEDEDALFCDFAETYHILDFYDLPVETVARLAAGLRGESRIKSKLGGAEEPLDTVLLASAVDTLKALLWTKTKDAQRGRNYPKQITEKLMRKEQETVAYSSFDEFNAARNRILGVKNGN